MPMSADALRRQLSAIEPNEAMYDGIGPSEIDALRTLLEDPEAWLAARAAHALARIDADDARGALVSASADPRPEVRVAVAASAPRLPTETADAVLATLLRDPDSGVRKFAIRSTSTASSDAVKQRVEHLARTEPVPALRDLADDKTRAISG
jgi:HEAT repeat protein